MPAKCQVTLGAGSLACCRVDGHRTDNGPQEHGGCCQHSPMLGQVLLHAQRRQIGLGHPLACPQGALLDQLPSD